MTAKPSRSSRTSITSRVVPASAETMAASRLAKAFNRLDLPALGGPASTTRNPSRRISPRWPSANWDVNLPWRLRTASCACATARSDTSPSSEKSIAASTSPIAPNTSARKPSNRFDCTPLACAIPWRRCASVSASIRSARPSISAKSSLPFSKARLANSPGSAGRNPGICASASNTARTIARPPWRCSSAMSSPVSVRGAAK